MAITPLLKNLIDNTKPVQTKYTAKTAEDFKQQNISSNFQIYGNSPMKPAPIQFTPMPKQQPIQQPTVQPIQQEQPSVEGMINTFNANLPTQPIVGQGTIAPMPSINLNQPVAGIPQLPAEQPKERSDYGNQYINRVFTKVNEANEVPPINTDIMKQIASNFYEGVDIEQAKQMFPQLQRMDDEEIKKIAYDSYEGVPLEKLMSKHQNPILKSNAKIVWKKIMGSAGGVLSPIGEGVIDLVNESGIITEGSDVRGKIAQGDESVVGDLIQNFGGSALKVIATLPGFIPTLLEDPVGTVEALGEVGKTWVKKAIDNPTGTATEIADYGLENPAEVILALQGAKSLLKQGKKIAKGGQKIYNTAKIIAENQEVPVKFNRVNPGAITTPEMAQKFSQPVKETVRTTMPAREVIKVKAKQGFENLKRKAQEVLPKKGVQENVIDAGATDYSAKAQEVVQKAKDVFKKKPTAEVVTDTPETTGKSTLDKVQPSKKDVVQGERKGIDPIVVAVVKEKPGLFKQVQNGEITEETVSDRIIQAKEQKFSESSQIGKTYESMYQSEYKFDGNTILDQSVEKLKSLGISLEDGVKIDSTKYVAESGEKAKIGEALSKILDIQGKEVSVQELHTLRKSVDKLIKRSEGIDRKNSKAVLELRSIIDNELKDKIGGWKGLDEMSSQKYDEIGQIMSEFFDRKGKFKYDPKTLLTDRNKKKLDILEELIPGVKDEIIMLATHKSYLRSKNTNKPGTYRKSMIKQVASTLGGIAGVTAGNSTVGSILMGMAGTYVGEKVGAYFGDPESFIKSITKDNRGASIIDDIEIGQEISQADKEYLNSLVKEAIKSGKIQKTERTMKKYKEESIKKELKRGLDTLTRKRSMSLPEKTETNLGTKKNPIRAYDKRPKEEIKAQENKKQDFQKNYKVASLDNFTIDRAKRGELYFGDGTKVSAIKNKPAYPYNPIQAILEDGRTIDLMKQGNDLFVKKTVGLDNLKPKEKPIQTVTETPKQEGLMPRDEGYQSTIKEGVNTINLSEMTDDEFMNYQEKLDVDNISPDIEKAISDEIFRRSNIDIPQGKFIDSMMKEISIIDSMEQRVGTVGSSKVIDKKYKDEQQKAVDKRRESAIETIQEELGIDQNEAYDKYLELQNKYKYQQVIRDRSNIEPSEALETIRKYFDADELSVNFLDNIVTPSGQEAFGRYYNKTIDMIKNPHKTTADHESAHAYFDMFTSKEDQSKILEQIKKEQGFTDDLEAEEFLADGFADYVSGKAKMTYGQKIKEFFKNVWEQIKKFFGKEDQVKQFYNDIMNKRRKTLGKKTQLKFKDTKFETYGEADKYTIQPILDIRKEIKADIIKKDTLQKMINRQTYRGPERKALEEIVSNMKGDTIPKEEVINGLKASIMPLNASYTNKYADYNKLYTIDSYSPEATKHTASTIILEAPFTTNDNNHFNDPNYFSHVRVSNEKGDYENRVLMELQSDLMQHEEKYSDTTDIRKTFSNDDILKAVKDLIPQSKIDEFLSIAMDNAETNPGEYRKNINIMNINKAITKSFVKGVLDGDQELMNDIIKKVNKNLSLGGRTQIGNYRNEAWMRRTIDETIKHLSDEGTKTLKVPYGITVAMIEGHYRPVGNIEQSDVQRVIHIALGNDNIRNLAEEFVSETSDERDELSQEEKFDMIDRGVKSFLETQGVSVEQKTITDPAMFEDLLDMLEDSIEPNLMNKLKASGEGSVKIGEDHSEKIASMPKQFQTVANFYEKQLMKYVKKQYPGGKDVEYEGGIWHEIDISQYGDKPLRVYQTKDSVRKETGLGGLQRKNVLTKRKQKMNLKRYTEKGRENTDNMRGGTWFMDQDIENGGYLNDYIHGNTGIGGSNVFTYKLQVNNPLIINSKTADTIGNGSIAILNSDKKDLLSNETIEMLNDLIRPDMEVDESSYIVLKNMGYDKDTIDSIMNSGNSIPIIQDLIISKDLKGQGYDSIILNGISNGKEERHVFRFDNPEVKNTTPELSDKLLNDIIQGITTENGLNIYDFIDIYNDTKKLKSKDMLKNKYPKLFQAFTKANKKTGGGLQ